MTLGQFLQNQKAQLPAIQATMVPQPLANGTQIGLSKSGTALYPLHYPVTHGPQMSVGVQRQLRSDMIVSVDFVRRVTLNTNFGNIDYNKYNRYINRVQ